MANRRNPPIRAQYIAPGSIYGIGPYVSRHEAVVDPWSALVRAMKEGRASASEMESLAKELAPAIDAVPELAHADFIVPMPRREPGASSDLLPLARLLGKRLGQRVLARWLVRRSAPTPSFTSRGRPRSAARAHRDSFVVIGPPEVADAVYLLDNVLTEGGTMVGAQEAVLRDTGRAVPGVAILYEPALQTGN